jgi:AraC-like DNA-binding protein
MQAGTIGHRRITPQASIAPVVSALFVVECDDDTRVVSLPRAQPQLVVRFRPSALVTLDVHAVGAGATVHRKAGDRGQRAVVARLRLGTPESLLGGPASTIAHRIVPLDDLWGAAAARRLVDRLSGARDTDGAAAILETAIADRLAAGDARCGRSRLAVEAAARLTGASVSAVAADLRMSERHLRRIFREAVGVSPKVFTRLARFHRALRAARGRGRPNWAGIAAAAGYYDQAHLVAEFRSIAGATPRAFLDELGTALSVG